MEFISTAPQRQYSPASETAPLESTSEGAGVSKAMDKLTSSPSCHILSVMKPLKRPYALCVYVYPLNGLRKGPMYTIILFSTKHDMCVQIRMPI